MKFNHINKGCEAIKSQSKYHQLLKIFGFSQGSFGSLL